MILDYQAIQDVLVKPVTQAALVLKVLPDHQAIQEVPGNLDYPEHQVTSQVQLGQLGRLAKMVIQEVLDLKEIQERLAFLVIQERLELRV